ncbi:uncharacterized protein LOC144110386 isoform X1 [Amblyomma americanum]
MRAVHTTILALLLLEVAFAGFGASAPAPGPTEAETTEFKFPGDPGFKAPPCADGEEFGGGGACENECRKKEENSKDVPICTFEAVLKCFCKKGWIRRLSDGKCITIEECNASLA